MKTERERIIAEFDRRQAEIPAARYSPSEPSVLFAQETRERILMDLFRQRAVGPLCDLEILDVGCGYGDELVQLESWGARRENLTGLDLHPGRAAAAAERLGPRKDRSSGVSAAGADIRMLDASSLPWRDQSFDLVVASTVFSSILDDDMQAAVAGECRRVLRRGGWILWYDFFVDNPRNPAVRGIGKRRIRALFPGFDATLRRTTLAPPLARSVVSVSRSLGAVLQSLRVFNTHYLGLLEKP